MIYLDASVAVSAITYELTTTSVQKWLETIDPDDLLISAWCSVEVAAALSFKVRTKQITEDLRIAASDNWARLVASACRQPVINEMDFVRATSIAAAPVTGLRGGDALHVAICERAGARLATLDKAMSDAIIRLGMSIEPVI